MSLFSPGAVERSGLFLGLILGCSEPPAPLEEAPAVHPEVVIDLEDLPDAPVVALITVDTWRVDHFSAEHTPALWKLAEDGEHFTHAMSPMGLTSPAHATMFTGLMPWEHGMEGNNHHGYRMSASVPVLADRFPGYRAGAFVSAYPAGPEGGLGRGWEVFSGPEEGERPSWVAVQEAVNWLSEDAPSLLWVHVYEPHGPYEGSGTTDRERYGEEVALVDRSLAPLVELLRARGATIVLAGDHGEVLDEEICGRQHERSSSDWVLRVPLVRWVPGIEPRKISELVGLDQVPRLLSGEPWEETEVWLAESGMCEPGCSQCAPEGMSGRDRVAVGRGGRLTHRPGQGWIEEGTVGSTWKARVEAIPPLAAPIDEATSEQVKSLGY